MSKAEERRKAAQQEIQEHKAKKNKYIIAAVFGSYQAYIFILMMQAFLILFSKTIYLLYSGTCCGLNYIRQYHVFSPKDHREEE